MPWANNIAKTMKSKGRQFTVTREMLTAVACDQRWRDVVAGISAVRFLKLAFVLFWIESQCLPRLRLGKQNSLSPSEAVIVLIIISVLMNQILHCDWLPERGRWSYLAPSGLPAVPIKKKFRESYIINPLFTRLVRSRWLDIGLVLFCEFVDLDSVSVNNPYICVIVWQNSLEVNQSFWLGLFQPHSQGLFPAWERGWVFLGRDFNIRSISGLFYLFF